MIVHENYLLLFGKISVDETINMELNNLIFFGTTRGRTRDLKISGASQACSAGSSDSQSQDGGGGWSAQLGRMVVRMRAGVGRGGVTASHHMLVPTLITGILTQRKKRPLSGPN